MQKSNAPTKLTVVFASGSGAGPVNNVPLTPGATPGTASYQTGFTSVNMEPIASGGIPPFGADFNGVIKDSTTAQIWQQCGYMYPYDSGFASNANINGYPANSVLMMGNGKGMWLNSTDNNTANPDASGSTGWIGLPAAGTYTITTTGGTTTPDASTLGVTTLIVTGALTSNATLVLPLTAGSRWIIANATTGAFTLTVHGSSGAGVSITQGSALTCFTDGVAYFATSANLSGAYLPIDGTAVAATKLATARAFQITGFATAAAINFDGSGNVIFNVTALNVAGALGYTPANDADVVHLAGTETITGVKTFSASVIAQGLLQGSQISATGAGGGLIFHDRSGTNLWQWYSDGGNAALYNSVTGTSAAAIDAFSSAWTFPTAITCTTMNASSSDRRLKRNIRNFTPRPLHRTVPFVSYTLKENGWHGLGAVAQSMRKIAPEHVGEFDWHGKRRLNLNYAGAAYEQAIWAGRELDQQAKLIASLEKRLAKLETRK